MLFRKTIVSIFLLSFALSCTRTRSGENDTTDLGLKEGAIALCYSDTNQFGKVFFESSCAPGVKGDFDLAVKLLHSFEYDEAEKVFARIIEVEPTCLMAYWGAAMCSFHPLWEMPSESDIRKGARIIAKARVQIPVPDAREAAYLGAIATIYDSSNELTYRNRLLKFEHASEKIFEQYPNDKEAAIFYALALRAAADPTDKSFVKQKKAGEILERVSVQQPEHPGIAHYIIHTYDYPQLAERALPAARKYASIASASAHAQHMPSHIFIRLGYWDDAIRSNQNSSSAAHCYAENVRMNGTWSEELHALDYIVYAYLQKADDEKAREQLDYIMSLKNVWPEDSKAAYALAAVPARYAVERKDWKMAAALKLPMANFPWHKFPWERANFHFAKLLGNAHLGHLKEASDERQQLVSIYDSLQASKNNYKANLVEIQLVAADAWIQFAEGKTENGIALMTRAAAMESSTEKHPVTPGEIIPAYELLGDMYAATKNQGAALAAYEEDLRKHPGRFNGLYGAGMASKLEGDSKDATAYFERLAINIAPKSNRKNTEVIRTFSKQKDAGAAK